MRKKLVVCGDSFYSPVTSPDSYKGLHFCEVLTSKLDWDLVSYAKGACSNQVIRLQLDEAVKEKPDLVIVGVTNPERVEIPVIQNEERDYWKLVHSNENSFRFSKGLGDIVYNNRKDTAQNNPIFHKAQPRLLSETLNSLFWYRNMYTSVVAEESIDALEEWFYRIYDMNWKKLQDTWVLLSGFNKLEHNNIPYFVVSSGVGLVFNEDTKGYEDKFIYNNELDPRSYYNPHEKEQSPFHITVENSITLGDKWASFLKNQKLYEL